jgi:hypothetical protein
MTIKELIAVLSTFDADLPVVVSVAYADEQFTIDKNRVGLAWIDNGDDISTQCVTLEIDADNDCII